MIHAFSTNPSDHLFFSLLKFVINLIMISFTSPGHSSLCPNSIIEFLLLCREQLLLSLLEAQQPHPLHPPPRDVYHFSLELANNGLPISNKTNLKVLDELAPIPNRSQRCSMSYLLHTSQDDPIAFLCMPPRIFTHAHYSYTRTFTGLNVASRKNLNLAPACKCCSKCGRCNTAT